MKKAADSITPTDPHTDKQPTPKFNRSAQKLNRSTPALGRLAGAFR